MNKSNHISNSIYSNIKKIKKKNHKKSNHISKSIYSNIKKIKKLKKKTIKNLIIYLTLYIKLKEERV